MERVQQLEKQVQKEEEIEEDGRVVLSKNFPRVTVQQAALPIKLSSPTMLGKIKGVYDLLLSREDQARYSGRGKGKFEMVPQEIFGAMKGKIHFFFL